MTKAVFLLLFLTSSYAQAGLYMTRINSGTTATVDRFCHCRSINNGNAKDIMVAHKTVSEWASFRTAPPSNVTVTGCFSTGANLTSLAFTNITSGISCAYSNTIVVDSIENTAATIYIRLHHPSSQPSCGFQIIINGVVTNLSLPQTVSVCMNDEVRVLVSCGGAATGYIAFYENNAMGAQIADVEYSLGNGGCPF